MNEPVRELLLPAEQGLRVGRINLQRDLRGWLVWVRYTVILE
jgi:hypothetical protein